MQQETAIASLIARSSAGDPEAASNLFLLAYDELRGLARAYLRRERYAQSIEATGLVHEAYMRLVPNAKPDWKDRGHFMAIAARAMRQVLVEHARARTAQKRGGGQAAITLTDFPLNTPVSPVDLLALDGALKTLAEHDSRMAELVELRFFGGFTLEEAAETLDISAASAKRWWKFSRAWLQRELDQ
jgi:RNA polymerase sigma factor (TIGR02999 family)